MTAYTFFDYDDVLIRRADLVGVPEAFNRAEREWYRWANFDFRRAAPIDESEAEAMVGGDAADLTKPGTNKPVGHKAQEEADDGEEA